MATTTEAPPKRDIKDAFGHITSQLEKLRKRSPGLFTEANIKIAAHIRTVTDGKFINLPIYHASDLSEETKFQTYRVIFNALIAPGGPDFTKLSGATVEETKKPSAPEKKHPAESTTGPTTARTVTPKAAPVNKPEEPGSLDDQVAVIARAEIFKFQRDFIEAEFENLLEKHLSNGSFPTSRVEEIVNRLQSPAVSEERIREIVREETEALRERIGKDIGLAIAQALGVSVTNE